MTDISICKYSAPWLMTIRFQDGASYTYAVGRDGQAPRLLGQSTGAQRAYTLNHGGEVYVDCYETVSRGLLGLTVAPRGTYRFDYKTNVVTGYIREAVAIEKPFGPETKALLDDAGRAVKASLQQHKTFVPAESTWVVQK